MLFGLASLPENLGVNWFSSYNWPLNIQGLGTEDYSVKRGGINVYPNPFAEKITILVKEIDGAIIKIMDLSGKTIMATKMNDVTETIYLPKDLTSGIYLLELKTNTDTPIFKIIKK
jgi:hypothetical protein